MVVIALALVAAALNALGAAGEQRAASRLAAVRAQGSRTPEPVGQGHGLVHGPRHAASRTSWRHTRRAALSGYWFAVVLVTTPMWLAGWSADVAGFVGQAVALHLGSLSVVQPLMVTTLLFSLPLAALGSGQWLSLRDWGGAVAISAGLGFLLSTRHVSAPQSVHEAPLVAAMLIVAAGAVGLAILTRTRIPTHKAAMLSVAAGALFSVGAAATKLTTAAYAVSGFSGLVTSWSAYVLAAASVGGLALQQAGFASGSLPVAMTALVITDPLVSYGLGLVGFGEPAPTGSTAVSLAVVGAVVLVTGVAALAHSPLLHPETVETRRRGMTPRRELVPPLPAPELRQPQIDVRTSPAPAASIIASPYELPAVTFLGLAAPQVPANRPSTRCCPVARRPPTRTEAPAVTGTRAIVGGCADSPTGRSAQARSAACCRRVADGATDCTAE